MTAGRFAGQSPTPSAAPAEPQRTCVGCRQRGDRSRLLRVVADRSEARRVLVPDPGARLPGRGAWLHPALACLELAERRRAFPRALRLEGPLDAGAVREHLQQHVGSNEQSMHASIQQ
ncbi:hypothetical protein SAMN06264364_101428 [Quadrisphaera granulorum]|uniref:YlxR domain-containing protein n=1 Tax=Quadrisphaera granulorum TaxID=317664 RepID=A0A316AHN2_9ACTN|nr:YlxR family protein [Quadrisphaera granulorum]PWJ56450.1 hypothetical protein BXY45_101428 [Quadrisphaera granulorum]SZE95084.1 hypothetical protein SAMN06264364_101428 [Quadrisphaera granulorum]